jgi:hypothetical protein
MATVKYQCDTCSREIELLENPRGLTTFSSCIITEDCRGTLYKLNRNQYNIRESFREADPDSNIKNYSQRKVLHEFTKSIPSKKWNINHNLGVFPAIDVFIETNDGQNIEKLEKDQYSRTDVDSNNLELKFNDNLTGIVQSIARSVADSNVPQFTDEENRFLVSYNGTLSLAILSKLFDGINWGAISELTIKFEVSLREPNQEEINCTEIFTGSSSSPWFDYPAISFRKRRNYTVKTTNILDLNVFAERYDTLDDIPELTEFKIKRIIVEKDDSTSIEQDIRSKNVLMLLADEPYTKFDKITDRIIDVGELNLEYGEADSINDGKKFIFFGGKMYATPNDVERVYPKIIKDKIPTNIPQVSLSPPVSPTPTPTPTPTNSITATPTPTSSGEISATPTPTPTNSVTPTSTPTPTPSPITFEGAVANSSPTAWFRFDEDAPAFSISDTTDTYSITPSKDMLGTDSRVGDGALELQVNSDGSTTVDLTNPANDGIAIEAVIRMPALGGSDTIVSFGDTFNGLLSLEADFNVRFYSFFDGIDENIDISSYFEPNVYQHIIIQVDLTIGLGRAYVDGNLIQNVNVSGIDLNADSDATIGDSPSPIDFDELIFYNSPLTATEINDHYSALPPKLTPTPTSSVTSTPSPTPTPTPTSSVTPTPSPMGWTPANITTALWLDGDDSGTITTDGSGNVQQWDDKSGNNRHASESNSSRRPQLSSSGLNGKDILSFDGVDDVLTAPAFSGTQDVTVMAVARLNSGSTATNPIPLQKAPTNSQWMFIYLPSVPSFWFKEGSSNPAQFGSYALDQWNVWGGRRGGSTIEIYIDGVLEGSGSSNPMSTSSTSVVIGGATNEESKVDFAEIILVPNSTSNSDRERLEGYLAHKWGLEANLPAGHPYKSAPP